MEIHPSQQDGVTTFDRDPGEARGLDLATVRRAVETGRPTPLLAFDLSLPERKLRRFADAMPRVRPHYAVKANADPALIRVLAAQGIGFEVASVGELDAVLAAGVAATDILFSNPVKPRAQVEYAVRAGVQWYALDSVEELHKIHGLHARASCYLRIETPNEGSDWPLTGKFGADDLQTHKIISTAARLGADLAGIQFHVGSQCRNAANWRFGINNARRVAATMHAAGLTVRLLNIGGGFPVQHLRPIPSIEEIGAIVNAAIADLPAEVRVIAEPGRYLVSEAACLVCRVIGTATRHGLRWVYLDGGVYHGFMETIGGLMPRFATDRRGALSACILAGPTCDALDVIVRDAMLPDDLREGDLVYALNAGAYTSAYATSFNGFPPPYVVVLKSP
jgi:ornithine decarboxylase